MLPVAGLLTSCRSCCLTTQALRHMASRGPIIPLSGWMRAHRSESSCQVQALSRASSHETGCPLATVTVHDADLSPRAHRCNRMRLHYHRVEQPPPTSATSAASFRTPLLPSCSLRSSARLMDVGARLTRPTYHTRPDIIISPIRAEGVCNHFARAGQHGASEQARPPVTARC
ncbi:hypothetical protein EI94DRAFT_1094263 [Lactarius quietus]|nr:hypothetical protein EI94DRAFT_1094263 [Lactarius quietus]